MQPEKFDELLRRSVETERELPFDEHAWQQLAGHLNAVQPPPPTQNERRRSRWLVVPWLILLPLLAWNFWLQSNFLGLKNELAEQQKALSETLDLLRDTAARQRIFVQHDTVWLSQPAGFSLSGKYFSSKNLSRTTAAEQFQNFEKLGFPAVSTADFQFGKTLAAANFAPATDLFFAERQTENSPTADASNPFSFQKSNAADLLPVLLPPPVETERDVFFKKPAADFLQAPIKKLRQPLVFAALARAGGSSTVVNFENGWLGCESGVQLSVGRGRRANWSALLGLERRWGWFLPSDGSLHEVLPAGQPADPNDELHHANAAFRWFSMTAGLQKNWGGVGRTTYFAAAGAEADFARKANYDYEFLSALDPKMEYHNHFSGAAAGWELTRFWLQAGLRRDWRWGWFWQLSLSGRAGFRASHFFPDQRFLPGLQLGFGRNF